MPASSAYSPSASPTAPNLATEYGTSRGHGDEAADRRDDADPAVAGIPHDRQDGEREVHRPPEHRVDRVVEVAQRDGVGVPDLDHPRDVDRRVEGLGCGGDLVDDGRDGLLVAHVADPGDEAPAGDGSREDAGGAFQLVAVAGAAVDDVAALEQLSADEQSETAGGAHDDGRTGRGGDTPGSVATGPVTGGRWWCGGS